MSASERLTELNIELPATPVSLGAYAPAKRVGTQVFTSGQLPIDLDGNIIITNKAFEDAIGAHLGDARVIRHAGEGQDPFALFLERTAREAAQPLKVEGMLNLPQQPAPLKATITPYRTDAGETVGAVFVIRRP